MIDTITSLIISSKFGLQTALQARDIQEFIPLINQLIVKYKERLTAVLQDIFMPVCASIIALLNLPYDPEDPEVSVQCFKCSERQILCTLSLDAGTKRQE